MQAITIRDRDAGLCLTDLPHPRAAETMSSCASMPLR